MIRGDLALQGAAVPQVSRRQMPPDLRGRLGIIGLIELIHLIELGGYDASLEICEPGREGGEVRLRGGLVLFARYGEMEGAEALLSLLGVRCGEFVLYASRAASADEDLAGAPRASALLMEYLRLEDELENFSDMRLPPEQPLALRAGREEPCVGGEEGSALVAQAIRERPGITLARLSGALPLAPRRVELIVAQLNALGRLDLGARPSAR